jgi:hypothetical protein
MGLFWKFYSLAHISLWPEFPARIPDSLMEYNDLQNKFRVLLFRKRGGRDDRVKKTTSFFVDSQIPVAAPRTSRLVTGLPCAGKMGPRLLRNKVTIP